LAQVRSIDAGSETIKAVLLEQAGGAFVLKRSVLEPLGDVARLPDGPEKKKLITKHLSDALKAGRLRSDTAIAMMPGRSGTIRYMKVPPVPPWRLKLLVEFEAKEQLAKGAACAYDHRILELPYSPSQMVVLVGVVQEQAANEAMDLLKSTGIDEVELDLSTTAVFNAYRYLHGVEEDKTTLFVDIGAEETHLVIERNGHLYFARTLMSGGRRFTQAVATATGLAFPEAEELKLKEGEIQSALEESSEGDTPGKKANLALIREASSLAASLEASLMYAKTQTGIKELTPERLVLAGGGAELKGLLEFLGRRLKTAKAERFEPTRNLQVRDVCPPPETLRRMAGALGTAIARLEPMAFSLDLLPDAFKKRREFFRHDIYLYYAVAVVLGALGMFVYRNVSTYLEMDRGITERRAVLKNDADALENYDVLKEETQWQQLDLNALLERVYSGRDILRVMSIFRKKTPQEIRLVEVAVGPPAKLVEAAKFPAGGSFQETRRLFVRGIAESKLSDRAAVDIVTLFAKELKDAAPDLFPSVETVYISFDVLKAGDTFQKEFVLLLELGEVGG